MSPGLCAFCGAGDNAHRTLDAVVDRVIAGERIAQVCHDLGTFTPREVWLMTTVALSERWGRARSATRQDAILADWQAFNEREGWEADQSREVGGVGA